MGCSPVLGRSWFVPPYVAMVGGGSALDRMVQARVEQQTTADGAAPVESQHAFVEVCLHVLGADRTLRGSYDPTYDEGKDWVASGNRP